MVEGFGSHHDADFGYTDARRHVSEFENVFGVKIPDEDAEKIQTVGDAVSYIENKLKEA